MNYFHILPDPLLFTLEKGVDNMLNSFPIPFSGFFALGIFPRGPWEGCWQSFTYKFSLQRLFLGKGNLLSLFPSQKFFSNFLLSSSRYHFELLHFLFHKSYYQRAASPNNSSTSWKLAQNQIFLDAIMFIIQNQLYFFFFQR